MVGTIISHYKILEKLGEGGMGVVYKAQDTVLDRIVALKFLPPVMVLGEKAKTRLIHEAKAAAQLDHPNVCTIHEIEEEDGNIFLVMAFVEGQTLKQKVEMGPLTIEEAINFALQIVCGLTAAHAKGIVHRDIKSANIMIASDGQVKITDFGLAKFPGQTQLTRDGTTVGTVAYMSPEQARGETVDHRSDIWSFGVVMYEMLSGQLPFRSEYEQAIVYSIMNLDPGPIRRLREDVPEGLQHIVEKAMRKDRKERYQNVEGILSDLHALGATPSEKPARKAGGLGAAGVKQRITSRRGFRIALAVSAALGLAALSYWFVPQVRHMAIAEVPSIAILQLKNLGPEADDPYTYGITQDLIVDIAKAGRVRVTPMKDILALQTMDLPIEQIAGQLRVRYVMEGSLRREADLFRLAAQIVEATTGKTLWADRIQVKVTDAAALQGRLAQAILGALDVHPSVIVASEITKIRTTNPEAYEFYLRAKYIFERKKTKEDVTVARGLYQQAIDLDSSFVSAKLGLGDTHDLQGEYRKAQEVYEDALRTAQAIGSRLDEAMCLLRIGIIRYRVADYPEAIAYYNLSLTIFEDMGDRDGQSRIFNNIGNIYIDQGEYNKAIDYYGRRLRIVQELNDRRGEGNVFNNIGLVHHSQGLYDKALEYFRKSVRINQEVGDLAGETGALNNMGLSYQSQGDIPNAIGTFIQSLNISRELQFRNAEAMTLNNIGLNYWYVGKYSEAMSSYTPSLAITQELGDRLTEALTLMNMGVVYQSQGDFSKALDYLGRSLKITQEISVDPSTQAFTTASIGKIFLAQGEYRRAADSVQRAVKIFKKIDEKQNLLWAVSLLALVEVTLGDRHTAEGTAREAEELLTSASLSSVDPEISWNLSQTYSLLHNSQEADRYLERSYNEIQRLAQKIGDKAMRQSYIENVKTNREVIVAWKGPRKSSN